MAPPPPRPDATPPAGSPALVAARATDPVRLTIAPREKPAAWPATPPDGPAAVRPVTPPEKPAAWPVTPPEGPGAARVPLATASPAVPVVARSTEPVRPVTSPPEPVARSAEPGRPAGAPLEDLVVARFAEPVGSAVAAPVVPPVAGPARSMETVSPMPVVARLLADRPLSSASWPTQSPAASARSVTQPGDHGASGVPHAAVTLQRFEAPGLPSRPAGTASPEPPPSAMPPTLSLQAMPLPSAVPSLPLPSAAPSLPLPPAVPSMLLPPSMPSMPSLQAMPSAVPAMPDLAAAGATTVDVPAASPNAPALDDRRPDAGAPGVAVSVPPPPGVPGAEPEELLKVLFEPLYRRLRAELRKDRDRRGLTTDLRR